MRTRHIFWPLFLVAVGVIWLLANLGGLPGANLWAIAYSLPYLLIALGIGLILRIRWPWASQLFSFLAVLGVVLAVVFAAPLGWNSPPAWGSFPFQITLGSDVSGAIRGSGVMVTETRTLDEFTGLSLNYPVEITIRQGEPQSVSIEAEDNLLPQLVTRVSGGTLHIESQNLAYSQRVYPTQPVRIEITVKDLVKLDCSTAAAVTVVNLKTQNLRASISGAGHLALNELSLGSLNMDLSGAMNVEANGTVDDLTLNISGVGGFEGPNLSAQTADVNVSGLGGATIWVVRQLTANISGVGSVNYYGSPQVTKQVSGVGSIDKVGDK
jgi:hypothetical protein